MKKVIDQSNNFPCKTINVGCNDIDFYCYKALLYQQLGEYDKARLYAEKAYKISQSNHIADVDERVKQLMKKYSVPI